MIEIDYCPQPFQVDFHISPKRFKIVAGGRRVGKSFCMLHEDIVKCLSGRNKQVWWVSPTLTDAREVGWEQLKNHIPELSPAIKYTNETRMIMQFTNGSRLSFKSAEKERSLRGRGLDHISVDEAAYIHPDIWRKALRPALSDKEGTGTLGSTTNGRNWFWEMFEIAKKPRNSIWWDRFHWPTTISNLISEDEIANAQSELSEIDFRQEYLAEFITRAGMVYEDFAGDNVISSFQIENHHDIFIGADFGYANPSALCFMAVDNRTEEVTMFDEIYVARTKIEDIADMIENVLKKWGLPHYRVKRIYTDPAGNAEELTSGISPVDYLRMERKWKVENKGSLIVYGLHLVRSFMKAADGRRKFFILNKCSNALKSISGYSYAIQRITDLVKEEPLKDGIHDHMCDAIRYFFVNRFDKAKWVANEPDIQSYLGEGVKKPIFKRCAVCHLPFPSKTSIRQPPHMCNKCKELNDASQLAN